MVDSQALIGRPAGIFDLNIDDNLEYSMGKFVFETWTKTAFESYWLIMQEHTICVKHSNMNINILINPKPLLIHTQVLTMLFQVQPFAVTM